MPPLYVEVRTGGGEDSLSRFVSRCSNFLQYFLGIFSLEQTKKQNPQTHTWLVCLAPPGVSSERISLVLI